MFGRGGFWKDSDLKNRLDSEPFLLKLKRSLDPFLKHLELVNFGANCRLCVFFSSDFFNEFMDQ